MALLLNLGGELTAINGLSIFGDPVLRIRNDKNEVLYELCSDFQVEYVYDGSKIGTKYFSTDVTTKSLVMREQSSGTQKNLVQPYLSTFGEDGYKKFTYVADCNDATFGISSLDGSCFLGCSQLTSARFPYLKKLGGNSFKDCPNLIDVRISSIEDIDGNNFIGCNSLNQVYVNSPKLMSVPDDYGTENAMVVNSTSGSRYTLYFTPPMLRTISSNSVYAIKGSAIRASSVLSAAYFPNLSTASGGFAYANEKFSNIIVDNDTMKSVSVISGNSDRQLLVKNNGEEIVSLLAGTDGDIILPQNTKTLNYEWYFGCHKIDKFVLSNEYYHTMMDGRFIVTNDETQLIASIDTRKRSRAYDLSEFLR